MNRLSHLPLRSILQKNSVLVVMAMVVLLSFISFHSVVHHHEQDPCIACHQKGSLASPPAVIKIHAINIPFDRLSEDNSIPISFEVFILGESRAPPEFLL